LGADLLAKGDIVNLLAIDYHPKESYTCCYQVFTEEPLPRTGNGLEGIGEHGARAQQKASAVVSSFLTFREAL
jgi:hypothetical protein